MTSLELLTVGRISVDLYGEEPGAGFAAVRRFAKSAGGSPTNVAVAAARLGHRAAVLTKVGDDPFGLYLLGALDDFGVDTRFVGTHPTLRTPLAFAALDPPEDPQLLFYRQPTGPDMTIEASSEVLAAAADVLVLWISASALAEEPSRSTVGALFGARGRRAHTVLDLDYRPMFWTSPDDARRQIGAAASSATVAVGNRTECEIAVGTSDPDAAASTLLERGVELAVVKLGSDGVLVAWPGGRVRVPPVKVEVVCGLGAGDAFGGALCHGLLLGWDPERAVTFANAAGAYVAGQLACADAMPSPAQVQDLLEGVGGGA